MKIMATEQQDRPGPEQEQQPPFAAAKVAVKSGNADLSAEIAAKVDREPGDRVRVTWIGANNYRCNWWAPGNASNYDNPKMYGLVVTTHIVRKSRFLTVTKVDDGLVIRDHAATSSTERGK
jgi:hypothetical protein